MVYRESLKLQSRDRAVSFHDVTEQVKEITAKSGTQRKMCSDGSIKLKTKNSRKRLHSYLPTRSSC